MDKKTFTVSKCGMKIRIFTTKNRVDAFLIEANMTFFPALTMFHVSKNKGIPRSTPWTSVANAPIHGFAKLNPADKDDPQVGVSLAIVRLIERIHAEEKNAAEYMEKRTNKALQPLLKNLTKAVPSEYITDAIQKEKDRKAKRDAEKAERARIRLEKTKKA